MHQKQPPAKVATASPSLGIVADSCCARAPAATDSAARRGEHRDETGPHHAFPGACSPAGTNFSATPFMQ